MHVDKSHLKENAKFHLDLKKHPKCFFKHINIYLAIFTARVSRITVTLLVQDRSFLFEFSEKSQMIIPALSSITFSLSTITRNSRPA